MARCDDCKREMTTASSCDKKKYSRIFFTNEGKSFKRDTIYFDVGSRCHDCGIVNKKGNLHHLGCDIERCPSHKGERQLISCGHMDKGYKLRR